MKSSNSFEIRPSARRLSTSLRDVGYSFESAIADLVDNSITAGASTVNISIIFEGKQSRVNIQDDGAGMSGLDLNEALRFGSRGSYDTGDLGRYGLGLKTASLSQCRRIEVFSRTPHSSVEGRALDLDFIDAVDDWLVTDISDTANNLSLSKLPPGASGSEIVWKNLDRILPAKSPNGGWAKRKVESLPGKLSIYLSMVFHRFLSGEAGQKLVITVNGDPLEPWDPFARSEPATLELAPDEFELETEGGSGSVVLRRFLLPTRERFTSSEQYERLSGPEKWNRQQGIYIYRANRLVQWGGWAGIRTSDEHTKFARASLDFDTDLDETFNINVAKMRVAIPSELRKMLARPVNELCMQADGAYRRSDVRTTKSHAEQGNGIPSFGGSAESGASIGLTLRAAAARTGNLSALQEVMEVVAEDMPELAAFLGFD